MRRRRAGMVLILMSGMVLLVMLLGLSLLWVARLAGRAAVGKSAAAMARLGAASGCEYAAARLSREPTWPDFAQTAADRGDDWRCRDGPLVPLGEARNPSYAHGDGSSGRVRGGLPFSLRIEPLGGKAPVNAGILSGPQCSDPDGTWTHRGVARVLDNLGAILLADGTPGAVVSGSLREDVPSGSPAGAGETIRCSRLGHDLLSARPLGGYRSLDQVKEALRARGYADAVDRIASFLDLGPYDVMGAGGRAELPYAPVELATAPIEVLQSLWTYIGGTVWLWPGQGTGTFTQNPYRRSGPSNLTFAGTSLGGPSYMHAVIFHDEAAHLAAEADALRRAGAYSWKALRERLVDQAMSIFSRDVDDLDESYADALTPLAQGAWARAKADLAYFAVATGEPPFPLSPSVSRTLGADLDIPSHIATQPSAILAAPAGPAYSLVSRMHFPDLPGWGWSPTASIPYQLWGPGDAMTPLGLSMAPPCRFSVQCMARTARGVSCGVFAALRVLERLELCCQEDFENLDGGADLARWKGIPVLDPAPAGRRPPLADPSGRTYPQAGTIPAWNPSRISSVPFSRTSGFLALAGRECGALGAGQYWPFPEDLDGNAANDLLSASGSPVSSFEAPGLHAAAPVAIPGGPHVEAFSMEAWLHPRPLQGLLTDAYLKLSAPMQVKVGAQTFSWTGALGLRASRVVESGIPGVRATLEGSWPTDPLLNPNPFPLLDRFVPDFDAATGAVQTGHYHVVLTLKTVQIPPPVPARYKTSIHLYVNGVDVDPAGRMFPTNPAKHARMVMSNQPDRLQERQNADEVRLYATELVPADVQSRYRMGRFVPPQEGPSADLLGAPRNPAYVSPAYVLGRGGRLRSASWTSAATPDLDARVGRRLVVCGLDAGGGVLWTASPAQDAWPDLSSLPGAHSFRYAVEFFSVMGAPADPLYDSPVVGPVSLAFSRPGFSPAWSAWAE